MARPRTPTHLRLVSGTRDKRSAELRSREPKPKGELTAPPAWFSDEQKRVWKETHASAPAGLLKRIDGGMLEGWVLAYCLRMDAAAKLASGQMLVKTPNGSAVQSPYIGILNRQSVIMKALAAEMGFSPAARTRIALDEAGEEDESDKYFPA